MNILVGTTLFLSLLAALAYALKTWVEVWNTRPVAMYDTKLERWRAHSLQGKPWMVKRHGPRPPRAHRPPALEQRAAWNDPLVARAWNTLPWNSWNSPRNAWTRPPDVIL